MLLFTVLTGHEDPAKEDAGLDLAEIARIPGTKVLLMGLKRLPELTRALIASGMPPETPVAIVQSATTGQQRSVDGTLATIAGIAQGERHFAARHHHHWRVVRLRQKLNWFETRPLFGRRVVVTRARAQAEPLVRLLGDLGADVLEIPAIRIAPSDRKQDIVDALLGLNAYDWLVFTSPNGVTAFFDLFFKRFQDLRDLGGARLAAIGPATAARLKELHLQVDLMPDEALASKIARAFQKFETIENLKICLLRAEAANVELPRALEEFGAIVDDIAVYKTIAETEDPAGAGARLLEGGADWITFTSASTVEHFHSRFELSGLLRKFPSMKTASIGPETSEALRAWGSLPPWKRASTRWRDWSRRSERRQTVTAGRIPALPRGAGPREASKPQCPELLPRVRAGTALRRKPARRNPLSRLAAAGASLSSRPCDRSGRWPSTSRWYSSEARCWRPGSTGGAGVRTLVSADRRQPFSSLCPPFATWARADRDLAVAQESRG